MLLIAAQQVPTNDVNSFSSNHLCYSFSFRRDAKSDVCKIGPFASVSGDMPAREAWLGRTPLFVGAQQPANAYRIQVCAKSTTELTVRLYDVSSTDAYIVSAVTA